MNVQVLTTIFEALAFAAIWGAFTWRAQWSGEMLIWPFVYLRRRKWHGLFVALLAIRWLQVAALVVAAIVFAIGGLPHR